MLLNTSFYSGFQLKVQQGIEKSHNSGFGPSCQGFTFSEAEANKKKASILAQKREMGIAGSDDEDEELEEEGDNNSEQKVSASLTNSASLPVREQALKQLLPKQRALLPHHEKLRAITAKLNESISNATGTPIVAGIQTTTAGETPHFSAELEINDFPQQARWKVTRKDALADITEFTSAAITTRGTYVRPGKAPPPGERKLYLFIEGTSEMDVANAKKEIERILEEAALTARPERTRGRFSFNFAQ